MSGWQAWGASVQWQRMRRHGGNAASGGFSMAVVLVLLGGGRATARDVMLHAKSLTSNLAGGDGGGTFGHRSPRWGRYIGALFLLHGVLLVKTLSSFWMSDDDNISVMPFLEASFLGPNSTSSNTGDTDGHGRLWPVAAVLPCRACGVASRHGAGWQA